MTGHNRRGRKTPLSFWEGAKRYGFWKNLIYRIEKARISPWFYLSIVMVVLIPIILTYHYVDFLPIIFYLFEIILIGYLLWRLSKKLDRIRINRRNHLRLFGLKILSGLVSAFGIFLLIYTWILFPFAMFESLFNKESVFTQIIAFGYQWHTPYIIPLFLEVFGLGLCVIGAYLFFKFQRLSGHIIWVGKMR